MGFLKKIIEFIKGWFEKLSAEEKRRLVIACTVGFSVLLTISVIISMIGSGEEKLPENEPERIKLNVVIPAEELFLPDEPDFLPGVLLERERRSNWNEQDAGEYWQNPLIFGEEQWREKIEAAVDDFLERIP